MFAPEFDYHKAGSVAEAVRLLEAHDGSKLIAGGHALIPLLKLRLARPSALIDISGIAALKGITIRNDTIHIGPLTTHWEIASSPEVQAANSLLAEAAGVIGDTQVRNRGTIGGNISHADPASDWPAVLTALDASFTVQGPSGLARSGRRTVAPADFFVGPLTTSLAENEIVTGIEVPALSHHQRAEYAKMAHPASSFSVVGAAVVVTVENNRCTAARIALSGLVPVPTRATSVENALVGQELNQENIAAAASRVSIDLTGEVLGDFYASAEYRRAMAAVEIRHALFHATEVTHH